MLHLLPILAPSCLPGARRKRSTRHDLRDSLRDSWRGGWGSDITDDAGLELYQQIGPPRRACLAFVEPCASSRRTRSSPPSCSSRRWRRTRRAAAAAAAEAEAEAEADHRRVTSACRSSAGGVPWTRRAFPAGTTPSRTSGPGRGPPGGGRRRRSSTRRRSATWKAGPRSRAGRRGIMLLGAIRSRRSHPTTS